VGVTVTAPTPAIPGFTAGQLVAAAPLNDLAANLSDLYTAAQGGFRTRKPICATRITSTTRPVANNTDVLVTWDVEDVDTDTMFTPGGTTITCHTAGIYRVGFSATLTPSGTLSGTPVLIGRVLVNTTTQTAAAAANYTPMSSGNGSSVAVAATVALAVNDVVRFYVRQNSGTAENFDVGYGGCRGFAQWLSP
jgi:hypothetical protein